VTLRALVRYLLFLAVGAVLALALLYPIALTVRGGFASNVVTGEGWTLRHIAAVFRDPVLRDALLNSIGVAAATTTVAILLALPLAMLGANRSFPFKAALTSVVMVPMILPPFVGALGLRMILGREGALNALLGTDLDVLGSWRFIGVVIGEALALYPIIYLNATAALANLDPALSEAAENLGAGPIRRFFTVTLPLIRPGLFAGATIVFIWSFTELGTPLMFDYYGVVPVHIYNGLKDVERNPQPYALTVVMLLLAIGMYMIGRVLFGGSAYAMTTRAARASAEKPMGPVSGWLAALAFLVVTTLAITPHIGVVLLSVAAEGSWYASVLPREFTGHNYEQALTHPLAFGSIVNSLKLASMAMALDVIFGVLIAYLIVRAKVRGAWLLDALAMLPLAVPGLVMAFGYVAMTLRWPFGPGDPLHGLIDIVGVSPNPVPLLVIAYSVRRLPYVVRSAVAGLQQTSGELEEAAINLGASTFRAVRSVVIPLIMANIIAGAMLAFSFAMLEVSDSLILAQQERHYPITKAIYGFSDRLGDGAGIASAMGVWGMALLTVTLVGASILLGKRLGALFRV